MAQTHEIPITPLVIYLTEENMRELFAELSGGYDWDNRDISFLAVPWVIFRASGTLE